MEQNAVVLKWKNFQDLLSTYFLVLPTDLYENNYHGLPQFQLITQTFFIIFLPPT